MHYVSLFSGIGGFEQAILKEFPNAECLGYSEIDPYALKVYARHFPSHVNLGDITLLEDLPCCDLIVAGFPCTNLSSMATIHHSNTGLQGAKSGLFYDLTRLLRKAIKKNPQVKILIENNNSMSIKNKELITEELKSIFPSISVIVINNATFGVQIRKRVLWSNFNIEPPGDSELLQTWNDVLEPLEKCPPLSFEMVNCINTLVKRPNRLMLTKHVSLSGETVSSEKSGVLSFPKEVIRNGGNFGNSPRYQLDYVIDRDHQSRWDCYPRSDTMSSEIYRYPIGKCRPILSRGNSDNAVLDRRGDPLERSFVPRMFTPVELERLFGFADGYTEGISQTRRRMVIGNTVSIFMIRYALRFFKKDWVL